MLSQQRNPCTHRKSAQWCTTRRNPLPFPQLTPGPCSSVGMWWGTDRHTDRCAWPVYISHHLRL